MKDSDVRHFSKVMKEHQEGCVLWLDPSGGPEELRIATGLFLRLLSTGEEQGIPPMRWHASTAGVILDTVVRTFSTKPPW